jgi:hypothetical protein
LRVDLLTIGPGPEQAAIHFHPRLTVVGGLDAPARSDFAELIVHALTGGGHVLWGARWVDNTGDVFVGEREGNGWFWSTDGGESCDEPAGLLGLDDRSLRRLMVLTAADLAPPGATPADPERPEAGEVRAALAAVDAELAAALAFGKQVDALRGEVGDIDERVRDAEANRARRRYGALVAQLEHVRAEQDSLRGGAAGAAADRQLMAAGDEVRSRADRWRRARASLRTEWARFGNRDRLDPRTLAEALQTPDRVPPELEELAALLEEAEVQRALLSDRLDALAAGALPHPSHPAVVRLAHASQDEVWAAARRTMDAAGRLEDQSLALGGLQAEGVSPSAAADLETAHDAVDLAVREAGQRRLPGLGGAFAGLLVCLVGIITFPELIVVGVLGVVGVAVWAVILPNRELARRQQAEADALQRAGVASYITFQMRRLEVNIDPKATEPLELAALEYRRAMAAWRKLAGDVAPADALALEAETRAYARALGGSRGAADEIALLRDRLTTVAEPAVAKARARLVAACEPFGIDDPRLAVEMVRHQASISVQARLQAALEQAERDEAASRSDLEGALGGAGFGEKGGSRSGADDADVERRLHAFEQARGAAEERDQARAEARSEREIQADLVKLEALVEAHRQPGWDEDDLLAADADIDREALARRRAALVAEYEASFRALPDVTALADRREALERRLAALGSAGLADVAPDADAVQQVLLGRLAAARRVGPYGESISVVFDEPFECIHGERKWAILDAIEKLSASVQLVYLTDDVDVLVWARRRASRGSVSLLEPASEVY